MVEYIYKARNLDNKIVKGSLKAEDINDLQHRLKSKKLMLVKAKEKRFKTGDPITIGGRVTRHDIVTFIRQLAVMVGAGIGPNDAINTLKKQGSSVKLKKILREVHDDLLKGLYLSDAFAKHPKIFPPFFKNMIYVGEISGNLESVLNTVADYYERDFKIRRKTKSAMAYPTFLFLLVMSVLVFLMVYIIPTFEEMLNNLGGNLPELTRIIVAVSNFFRENIVKMGIIIVSSLTVIFLFFLTKPGQMVKSFLKLHVPVLKSINNSLITARFARGLGVLISSGILVLDSMEIIGKLMENVYFEKKFSYAIDEVKRGKRIARSIDNIKFFPEMLIEMILVGENTGSLEIVLEKTADYYDDQLEKTIAKATASIEPVLILFAGFIIAVVILGVFLPMFSIMDSIG